MENNYTMVCNNFIPLLTDKNEIFIDVKEDRDIYIRTIKEDIKKVFQIADIPNLIPSIDNWEVKIGEENVILKGNFLGIGTTREIGYRNDPLFYQFKHNDEAGADISRIHCILYFYEEFVVVVDLWSYNGTDVIINRNLVSSIRGERKLIKITNNAEIILRRCPSAKNIIVSRIENKNSNDVNIITQTEKKCVICINNHQTHIIIPCGHKCLCTECSIKHFEKINICPICRCNVQKIQRVFDV